MAIIHNEGEMDANEIFNWQPPIPESEHSHATPMGSFNGTDIKRKRDYTKCVKCGGTGRYFKNIEICGKKKYTKRQIKCECKYGKNIGHKWTESS